MKNKIYGTECLNCGHRIGVHYVGITEKDWGKEECNGYVRKDQPNYDGKPCNCKHYVRPNTIKKKVGL